MIKLLNIIILLLISTSCLADTIYGRVIGVSDGDTVTVLVNEHDQYRIRITGIDAPEKKQAFGQKAKAKMSDLVFGKDVTVEWNKKDRYGRTLGVVMVDGQDAGFSLLHAGLAWHYKKYQREQSVEDRERYSAAEDAAKVAGIGLWVEAGPVPPWEWRRSRR